MIQDVLKAAKALYDQVDKAKHNSRTAKYLVDSVNRLIEQVVAASSIVSDQLESDTLSWIDEAHEVLERFEDKGWDLNRVKRFIRAGGYQQKLADLYQRLNALQDAFNAALSIGIHMQQTEYYEALKADNDTFTQNLSEIVDHLAVAREERQRLSHELKDLIATSQAHVLKHLEVVSAQPTPHIIGFATGSSAGKNASVTVDLSTTASSVEVPECLSGEDKDLLRELVQGDREQETQARKGNERASVTLFAPDSKVGDDAKGHVDKSRKGAPILFRERQGHPMTAEDAHDATEQRRNIPATPPR